MYRNFFDESSGPNTFNSTYALEHSLDLARKAHVGSEERRRLRFIPPNRFYEVTVNLPLTLSSISDLLAIESQCLSTAANQLNGVKPKLFFQSMSLWISVMCKLGAYANAYEVVVALHVYGVALRHHKLNSEIEGLLNAQKDVLKRAAVARTVLGSNSKHVFSKDFLDAVSVHSFSKAQLLFSYKAAVRCRVKRAAKRSARPSPPLKEKARLPFKETFYKQSFGLEENTYRTPLTHCVSGKWSGCECGAFSCPMWQQIATESNEKNRFETCVSGGQAYCTCGAINCGVWNMYMCDFTQEVCS